MSDKQVYDPEDIESLLIHKEFEELYPAEKEFVLKHIEQKTRVHAKITAMTTA